MMKRWNDGIEWVDKKIEKLDVIVKIGWNGWNRWNGWKGWINGMDEDGWRW